MNTGTWTDIKAGLRTLVATMTVANGYNYDWPQFNKEEIVHEPDIYVTVKTPDGEENTDGKNRVSTGLFDNTRKVQFYLFLKNKTGEQTLDNTKEKIKDLLELGLDDFNNRFNGTIPNELCSAGVYKFDYSKFSWVNHTSAGEFSSVKMLVTYNLSYRKDRNIS